jgi:hypothetical protein
VSYPSLIVEVILAVFVCRGNRFSMLIEATLEMQAWISHAKQMRCRLMLEQSMMSISIIQYVRHFLHDTTTSCNSKPGLAVMISV